MPQLVRRPRLDTGFDTGSIDCPIVAVLVVLILRRSGRVRNRPVDLRRLDAPFLVERFPVASFLNLLESLCILRGKEECFRIMPTPRSKPGEIPQIQFYAPRNMACIYIDRKRIYLGPCRDRCSRFQTRRAGRISDTDSE